MNTFIGYKSLTSFGPTLAPPSLRLRRPPPPSFLPLGYKTCSRHINEVQDLGIWISHDLEASQQCVQAYLKANRLLGVLNRTIKCKDTDNLVCFCKSLAPGILYCSLVTSLKKERALIEKVQRRFTS